MNDACGSERHADFPATVWVVVEQPPGEEYRLDYNPEDGSFRRSESRSLIYDRGFTGAYGWVEGLGAPPGRHCDAILITRRDLRPGDVVTAHPCGIFYRGDGDHKLVALDEELWGAVDRSDLSALDPETAAEVRALYPRIGRGEGWWGAEEAREYLRNWDARPGESTVRHGRPVRGPEGDGD